MWYDGNSGGRTHHVAQKRPNRFGLFDVLGNAWEWVNDWYDDKYHQSSPSQDPPGEALGAAAVVDSRRRGKMNNENTGAQGAPLRRFGAAEADIGEEKIPIPTRTANLWFARQFILAEGGGALLSEPARWTRFVKKLAPSKLHSVFGKGMWALRAALICVDCESFMKPGAAEALAASSDRPGRSAE